MTTSIEVAACRGCATPAPLGASFCPSCGAPLGDVALIRLEPISADSPDRRPPDTTIAERHGALGRRAKAWAALACAALVVALLATRAPRDDAGPSATSTTAAPVATTTASTTTQPTLELTKSAPPEPAVPALSGLPDIDGFLVAVDTEGELVQVALETGQVSKIELGGTTQYAQLRPFGSNLIVQFDAHIVALTPSGEQRPLGAGWAVSVTNRFALVVRPNERSRNTTFDLVDSAGTAVATLAEENAVWASLTPDGRVVVQRAQRIGTVDPQTGTFTHIADGVALSTTTSSTLLRMTCQSIRACEVRSGPFEDPDRWRVSKELIPSFAEFTPSPDGRYLAALSWDTEERTLIDLADGSRRELGARRQPTSMSFSADGRWLALISESGSEIELVSVDGREPHTVDLGGGQLAALTFADQPAITP